MEHTGQSSNVDQISYLSSRGLGNGISESFAHDGPLPLMNLFKLGNHFAVVFELILKMKSYICFL
jgi:hypothetical protein